MTTGGYIGQYKIEGLLGKGGFAHVYLARQESIGRNVAIKVLRPDLATDPVFSERFLNEARIVARLKHPHIVTIHDFVNTPDCLAIVMEYIEGEVLEQFLQKHPNGLPLKLLLPLFLQVLDAMGYAHQQNVLHRDLKPANLFITPNGAKLVDFGIAKAIDDADKNLTRTGRQMGSPNYMSPEQVKGEPLGPASDIYALGMLLYELATGRHPYAQLKSLYDTQNHIVNVPLPAISAQHPHLPQWLDTAVFTATAKDPTQRFASCQAFANFIRQQMSAPPAAPKPTPPPTPGSPSAGTPPTTPNTPPRPAAPPPPPHTPPSASAPPPQTPIAKPQAGAQPPAPPPVIQTNTSAPNTTLKIPLGASDTYTPSAHLQTNWVVGDSPKRSKGRSLHPLPADSRYSFYPSSLATRTFGFVIDIIFSVITIGIGIAINVGLQLVFRTTVGRRLAGYRILRVDGTRPSVFQLLIRGLCKVGLALLLLVYGYTGIAIALDGNTGLSNRLDRIMSMSPSLSDSGPLILPKLAYRLVVAAKQDPETKTYAYAIYAGFSLLVLSVISFLVSGVFNLRTFYDVVAGTTVMSWRRNE
jgi:serine/threonine-protein kinase